MNVEQAMARARILCGDAANLREINTEGVAGEIYSPPDLSNCYIFRVDPGGCRVGAMEHIAVPKDGREPFSLGEIGE